MLPCVLSCLLRRSVLPERDSLLAKASVLSFLLVTFTLLASAAFKERIHAALAGQDGRLARLWEVRLYSLPKLG